MPRTERDIVTGKVVAPFGIGGEVKLVVLTDFPGRFEAGSRVAFRLASGERRSELVQGSRPHRGGLILKLRGVDTRNDAEALRGAEAVIDDSELAELDADAFYLFDIVGLKVVTDDGREFGEVVEVVQSAANDVYITSTGLCVPALKSVVADVDVRGGVMTIRPVPGLIAE